MVTIASTSPLYQEYGPQYKVLEKALKVDLLEMGNGGFKCLVVIMEDGTIAVIEQTEVLNTKKLEAKKYNEYKRIVDVKNISVTDGITGAYSIVLIDINGKTYFFE